MKTNFNRRDFITTSAAAGLGLLATPRFSEAAFKTKLRKAKIVPKVTEEALKPLKDAGFDGVETSGVLPDAPKGRGKGLTAEELRAMKDAVVAQATQGRAVAEKLGMPIHSVLRGWAEFNSDDPAKVESSLALTELALRAAKAYGASAVLTVPCRVGGIAMPQPWEFKIEFDEKTGHVSKVVDGDNAPYKDYIAAQNLATDRSREHVKKLISLAEELKVIIALENVWNNLWVTPALYRNFVASFNHPWVKAYYDVGNHVKYPAKVQDWIHTLGPLIAKIHIKDYVRTPDHKGEKFVHPRDGSIEWPAVRQALDDVGYNGWLTIEDGGLPLEEFNKRIDLIIAGK